MAKPTKIYAVTQCQKHGKLSDHWEGNLGRIEEAKEETLQVPKCDSNLDIGISFDKFVDALYRAGWRLRKL